ncbi:hypothetical protein QE410_001950 [Microbacterium sp. SORGH_AS 1204]|nr:hypothetical protein [Microbacterium sp. SORGH_AS_1204]
MALAPVRDLFSVPSVSMRISSMMRCSLASTPSMAGAELVDDRGDGLQHALAAVTALVAVAQLVGLERAGGRAGGDGRPLDDSVVEEHLHLDGRVTARIQDLARVDSLDKCHEGLLVGSG